MENSWWKLGITGWKSLILLLWWIICNCLLFLVGYLEQKNDHTLDHLNGRLGQSVYISRGAGLVLTLQVALILLPVCKGIISFLMRSDRLRSMIRFDKNIHFHKIVAWTMLVFATVHVIAHLFNFLKVQNAQLLGDATAVKLLWTHPAGYTGIIMLTCMLLMYTSSWSNIKAQCFEMFWYTHHLFIPFFLAYFAHSTGCFVRQLFDDGSEKCKPYYSYYAALPGFILYMYEKLWRNFGTKEAQLIKVVGHPSDTIELQFQRKAFNAQVGQYVLVNLPEISKLQWHPFTLSSAPEESRDSIHIRIAGDWTRKVAERLNYYEPSGSKRLSVQSYPILKVDGPFGTPTQDVYKYDTVILIGAGIGVTPFASILKSIWAQCKLRTGTKHKKIHFFWICRDMKSFSWFQDLLNHIEHESYEGFLSIHLYLTKIVKEPELNNIVIHADDSRDPITLLKSQTHFGRPNFDIILHDLVEGMVGSSYQDKQEEVGVFFCGPRKLKHSIEAACKKQSNYRVRLLFHREKF